MISKFFNEIKNRFILIFLSGSLSFLTCYTYKETVLFLTLKNIMKDEYQNSAYLITTNITEVFSNHIKLSYFISTQFTIILIFYQITVFLSPGLYLDEYKKLKNIIFTIIVFLTINIILIHYFIFPFFWEFFFNYQNPGKNQTLQIYFEGKLNEYLNFYINTYLTITLLNLLFYMQFFVINRLKNTTKFVKNYRKVFYLVFILIATTITPPDVISQLVLILGLVSLFELTFLFIIFNKKRLSVDFS